MKIRFSIIFVLLLQAAIRTGAQSPQINSLSDLVKASAGWYEGYYKNLGDHEFSYGLYSYNVSRSLLVRCKEGENTIVWATAPVPEEFNKKEAGFLWLAAINLTPEKQTFDLYFNDRKILEIPASDKKRWQVTGTDGSTLSFLTIETDHNGDAFGYMWLVVPASLIKKGTSQQIKIVGRPAGSNTWMIIYQEPGALAYLQNYMDYDASLALTMEEQGRSLAITVEAPRRYAEKTLTCQTGGRKSQVLLKKEDTCAKGSFTLPLSAKKKRFELRDEKGALIYLPSPEQVQTTILLPGGILLNDGTKEDQTITITGERSYAPATVRSLQQLSRSPVSNGKIFLMNSSHQDIAWMDSPEKCVLERDTMLLSPLFTLLRKEKAYRFDVEDALMIKEFVGRHPDKKELVGEMLRNGQISCGATFTQPYEEMYSGEALARQFYFGAKWLKDEFGYTATVYWNEDVPGRTLQMMQMMRKAGVPYLMLSRFEKGFYHWYSPDGSFVTMFSPGHYGEAFPRLQKKFTTAADYLAANSLSWAESYPGEHRSPVIPLLSDRDMSPPVNYRDLITHWNHMTGYLDEEDRLSPVRVPQIRIVTAPVFFEALEKEKPEIHEVRGERPDVWVYIHGPSHQKALKASREADILLTQAEKFATANALVSNSFRNYPAARLRQAWEAKIYPDHGWGGKNGNITDALFRRKFEFAKKEAEAVLYESLHGLASRIKTQKEKGRPLVVFNSMDYLRDDPVSIPIVFDEPGVFSVELKNGLGKTTETQLTDITRFPDGSLRQATLHFIARQVPPVGYKTWYLTTSPEKRAAPPLVFRNQYENHFYRITFGDGGLTSLFDKELQRELIDTGKFKAGEVFTMHSEGNGAGEFADIQKPDMEGFDRTGNYHTDWMVEESGDLFTTIRYRQKIRNAVVEQRVRIYNTLKRIDFLTALLNWEGVLYREYRMALPLNMQKGEVAYEVPFGVVQVGRDEMAGAAGERYNVPCREMHPRGIGNWIGANNDAFGVTMSSTVAVADWIDPTDHPAGNPILQPVLLASRRSCHWEGNEYLQTGNHYFRFSVTSHPPGWQHGMLQGRGANEALLAVWADESYTDTPLPESLSFFTAGDPDIFIATVKKAEDNDDVVVRLVNMSLSDKKATLQCFKAPEEARLTSLIEEDIKPLPVKGNNIQFDLGHQAIETLRFKCTK